MLSRIQEIMSTENTESLTKEISNILFEYDVAYFLYGICIPQLNKKTKNLIVDRYPDNWMNHYMKSEYMDVDSVFLYSLTNNLPIVWDDILFRNSQKMRDESKDAGLRAGISFPIHSVTGEKGIFSISSSKDKKISSEAFMVVSSLLPYIHEKIKDLERHDRYPMLPKLTTREAEILQWAAIGKTAYETSCILNISERTIIYHLSNIMKKFDCNNKGQAVAFGLTHKIIQL